MNVIKKFIASIINSELKKQISHLRSECSDKDRRISLLKNELVDERTRNLVLAAELDDNQPTMSWTPWSTETPFESQEGRDRDLILVFESGKKLMARVMTYKRDIRLETMYGEKVNGTPVAWMAMAEYQ